MIRLLCRRGLVEQRYRSQIGLRLSEYDEATQPPPIAANAAGFTTTGLTDITGFTAWDSGGGVALADSVYFDVWT